MSIFVKCHRVSVQAGNESHICFLLLPKVRKIEIPNIPSDHFLLSPTIPSRKNPHSMIMLPMSLCQLCQRATCDRDLYCYRACYLFNISPPWNGGEIDIFTNAKNLRFKTKSNTNKLLFESVQLTCTMYSMTFEASNNSSWSKKIIKAPNL